MKSLLLKFITSAKLKSAIATAHQVAALTVDALRAILMADGLSDERRKQVQVIFAAAISIRDFLARLSELVGAPAMSSISSLEHLSDKASRLDDFTNAI